MELSVTMVDDAEEASDERDEYGFDDELADDVALGGADGTADANLASALEDGGEHDVHDADAADEKRDGSDGDHDGVEELFGAFLLGEQFGRNNNGKVGGVSVPAVEDAADDFGRAGAEVH